MTYELRSTPKFEKLFIFDEFFGPISKPRLEKADITLFWRTDTAKIRSKLVKWGLKYFLMLKVVR